MNPDAVYVAAVVAITVGLVGGVVCAVWEARQRALNARIRSISYAPGFLAVALVGDVALLVLGWTT